MELIVSNFLKIYPNDEFLLETLITASISVGKYDAAFEMANNALQLYPKSLRILYPRAIALCMNASQRPECLQALNDFLSVAPEDHDKVPTCHYRKASYYMVKMDMKNMMKSYEAGLAAENKQLPCFLPYDCPCKSSLERIQMMMKLSESENIKKHAPFDTGPDLRHSTVICHRGVAGQKPVPLDNTRYPLSN
uniref:Uncharacterized protein n=1 Tax=Panagrolaimus davidi TaxID=227884 RepID=A0A914RAI0_9BILA